MNSYKKLMNNSLVFAIGSLGSKLLYVLLLPLYTYYLTTSEFGNVDIITTTATMLIPVISFSMYDAIMRFALNKEISNSSVISNGILVASIGIIASFFLIPLLSIFKVFSELTFYLFIIISVQIFERILAQYARGIGKINIFAINGILLTFTTAILNIVLIVNLSLGVQGYLLSIVYANIVSIIFLLVATKAYSKIRIRFFDLTLIKSMLSYSLPLIPNTLMWWLINASSRFFILNFIGLSANGMYAVASRIPSLLGIVTEIFSQAWQLSAIEEYENDSKSDFYSKVLRQYVAMLSIGVSFILVIIKPLISFLFSSEYYNSWEAIPFLIIGVMFSSLSGFLGAFYIASKETRGVFKTSIYGGAISVVFNIVLIPNLGLIGAGISSMISFGSMFLLRYRDARNYVEISIKWRSFIINLILLYSQLILLFLNMDMKHEIIIELFIFLIIVFFNKDIFNFILFFIKSFF